MAIVTAYTSNAMEGDFRVHFRSALYQVLTNKQTNKKKHLNGPFVSFWQGGNLVFDTEGQPIPDNILARDRVVIRVTDVDEDDKRKIL